VTVYGIMAAKTDVSDGAPGGGGPGPVPRDQARASRGLALHARAPAPSHTAHSDVTSELKKHLPSPSLGV